MQCITFAESNIKISFGMYASQVSILHKRLQVVVQKVTHNQTHQDLLMITNDFQQNIVQRWHSVQSCRLQIM